MMSDMGKCMHGKVCLMHGKTMKDNKERTTNQTMITYYLLHSAAAPFGERFFRRQNRPMMIPPRKRLYEAQMQRHLHNHYINPASAL